MQFTERPLFFKLSGAKLTQGYATTGTLAVSSSFAPLISQVLCSLDVLRLRALIAAAQQDDGRDRRLLKIHLLFTRKSGRASPALRP